MSHHSNSKAENLESLELNRETLRDLTEFEADKAQGGVYVQCW